MGAEIKAAALAACPLGRTDHEHYRSDGTCMCMVNGERICEACSDPITREQYACGHSHHVSDDLAKHLRDLGVDCDPGDYHPDCCPDPSCKV